MKFVVASDAMRFLRRRCPKCRGPDYKFRDPREDSDIWISSLGEIAGAIMWAVGYFSHYYWQSAVAFAIVASMLCLWAYKRDVKRSKYHCKECDAVFTCRDM
jgi:hypothetical protein